MPPVIQPNLPPANVVAVPIADKNLKANSYSRVKIHKPYLAAGEDYYIQLKIHLSKRKKKESLLWLFKKKNIIFVEVGGCDRRGGFWGGGGGGGDFTGDT